MSKRTGAFEDFNSKKLKVDDNLDELWGEDPNIDDCLILATQACEQEVLNSTQLDNASILPSYNHFKQNKNLFTSTQDKSIFDEATFVKPFSVYENKTVCTNQELARKVQELKEQYESKEGEVSILRSQLKETKTNMELEYQKKEKELAEKISFTKKELISIKSELEFKNLEVVNLKNKINSLSKAYSADNFLNNTVNTLVEKPEKLNSHSVVNYRLRPNLETKYPLIETISPSIFNVKQFEHFRIDFKINQTNSSKKKDDHILLENHHNLDSILPDISALMTTPLQSINFEIHKHHIDRITYASYNILFSFHSYLSNYLDLSSQNENCHQAVISPFNDASGDKDLEGNLFNSRPWCDREIGIQARQTVAVLAEILPYSTCLQETLQNYIVKKNKVEENFRNYLNLILTTLTMIRVTKKPQICEGFLSALAVLVYKMSQTKIFNKCYLFTLSTVKELIFMRPPARVLKNLLLFFKQASAHPDFVKELCRKSGTASKIEDEEASVQDRCIPQGFVALYKQHFINRNCIYIDESLDTLQFIMNLMNCNPSWLHYQENNHCECLSGITRLAVNVIHEFVQNYKKQKNDKFCKKDFYQYNEFLKYSIKILNIVTSKYFDVINKYSVDSEYKFIVKYMLSVQADIGMSELECETLRELNLQEDLPTVNGAAFNVIPLWK